MSAPNVDPAVFAKVAALKSAAEQAIRDANGDRVVARELLIQRGHVPRGSAE